MAKGSEDPVNAVTALPGLPDARLSGALEKAPDRPFYAASRRGRRRRCWLIDILLGEIENNTSYHCERAEVRVKVGILGMVQPVLSLALFLLVVRSLHGKNWYLQEQLPVGMISMWAAGGDLHELADAQESGPLCGYNRSHDFLYGVDNEWDYTAIACDRATEAHIAFKHPSALHFITYEQRRTILYVQREGDSCDDECKSVIPAWPTEAEYGDRTWASAHVPTRLFRRSGRAGEDGELPENMRMMKPHVHGDMCRCYSFENTFLLGADAMAVVFNFGYDSSHRRGTSLGSGPNDPIGFALVQDALRPFKILPKGEVASFTIEEVLAAFDTCLDCEVGERFDFHSNDLCEPEPGDCPPPYSRKPSMRLTGAAVDMRTEYYSHAALMPSDEAYNWIRDNYKPPYAVVVLRLVVDWTSRGSDSNVVLVRGLLEEHRDTYRYGVVFRISPAAGAIAKLSLGVTVDSLVNVVVSMTLPGAVASFIVFMLCGKRSMLYTRGKTQILSVEVLHKSLAYTSLLAELNFLLLDPDGSGIIDRDKLFNLFNAMVRGKLQHRFPGMAEEWYAKCVETLLELVSDEITCPTTGKVMSGVTHEEFLRSATFNQAYNWDDLIERMVDEKADRYPGHEMAASLIGSSSSLAGTLRKRRGKLDGGESRSPNFSPVVPMAPEDVSSPAAPVTPLVIQVVSSSLSPGTAANEAVTGHNAEAAPLADDGDVDATFEQGHVAEGVAPNSPAHETSPGSVTPLDGADLSGKVCVENEDAPNVADSGREASAEVQNTAVETSPEMALSPASASPPLAELKPDADSWDKDNKVVVDTPVPQVAADNKGSVDESAPTESVEGVPQQSPPVESWDSDNEAPADAPAPKDPVEAASHASPPAESWDSDDEAPVAQPAPKEPVEASSQASPPAESWDSDEEAPANPPVPKDPVEGASHASPPAESWDSDEEAPADPPVPKASNEKLLPQSSLAENWDSDEEAPANAIDTPAPANPIAEAWDSDEEADCSGAALAAAASGDPAAPSEPSPEALEESAKTGKRTKKRREPRQGETAAEREARKEARRDRKAKKQVEAEVGGGA